MPLASPSHDAMMQLTVISISLRTVGAIRHQLSLSFESFCPCPLLLSFISDHHKGAINQAVTCLVANNYNAIIKNYHLIRHPSDQ